MIAKMRSTSVTGLEVWSVSDAPFLIKGRVTVAVQQPFNDPIATAGSFLTGIFDSIGGS